MKSKKKEKNKRRNKTILNKISKSKYRNNKKIKLNKF